MTPNQRWFDNRKRALDYLAAHFPESFGTGKPLKVGIINDIRSLEDSDKPALVWIRRALYYHTSRKSYLKNLKKGTFRVDLAGQPAGEVTAQEAENALERLANSKVKQKGSPKTKKAVSKNKTDDFCNRPILKLKKSKINN